MAKMSKGARLTLDQLGPKARAEAMAQLGQPTTIPAVPNAPRALQPMKTMRQDSKGMNKTEQAFYAHLCTMHEKVYREGLKIRLGNGVTYSPDFVVLFPDGEYAFYEVKGFMREDAAVKIKVAAGMFPYTPFFLVKREKGCWHIEKVLA